jgi:hypothetical protein
LRYLPKCLKQRRAQRESERGSDHAPGRSGAMCASARPAYRTSLTMLAIGKGFYTFIHAIEYRD